MPTVKNKHILLTTVIFFVLIVALPLILMATGKKHDIRPKAALTGSANLHLNLQPDTTFKPGDTFNVLASIELTDSTLRISGADFVILYDKNRLEVLSVVPQVTSVQASAPFTDAPIVTKDGYFDETYNFLRVAEVARKPDNQLPRLSASLALITFRAKSAGTATIKYPDDNKYFELVGLNLP